MIIFFFHSYASFSPLLVLVSHFGAHLLLAYYFCHYVLQLREELQVRGCQIKTSCEVHFVSASVNGLGLIVAEIWVC